MAPHLVIALSIGFLSFNEQHAPMDRFDDPDCSMAMLFGICDPFVPGVIISTSGLVRDTWPLSPAEKAKICPGDEIISVDGRPFSVEALVSPRPTTIHLRLRRNKTEFQRTVGKVRESELRRLSGMKFLGKQTVPTYQEPEGLDRLQRVLSHSFTRIPDRGLNRTATDYYVGLQLIYSDDLANMMVEGVGFPSPAHDALIQVGDVIASVNGTPISGIHRNLIDLIVDPLNATRIVLGVINHTKSRVVTLTPVKYREALAKIGRTLTACGSIPLHCGCSSQGASK